MIWFEKYVSDVRRHWLNYAENVSKKSSTTTSKVGNLGEDFTQVFCEVSFDSVLCA